VTGDRRHSPLHGFAFPRFGDRLTIAEHPYLSQFDVRARGEDVATAGRALGVDLPTTPNTVATNGQVAALWLGPDEWLIVGVADPPPIPPGVGLVDVSAQRTAIDLHGRAVLELLSFGCALDLERLGPRWCAQTELARTSVILWGSDGQVRILVRASFARHLAAWLVDAANSVAS